jgi:transcription antitermination factor NusB
MGKRRHARELALKVLFHMEFSPGDPTECFDLVWGNFGLSQAIQPFSREVVLGVWENKEYLDGVIREASQHWRLERMSLVDRNILRIALFEVLFMKDVPHKVSIDEAVELGKKYGAEESGAFINGILDHIYHSMEEKD